MKVYIRRAFTFTRQGRPASSAETAQPAGGRIEPGDRPLDHGIGVTSEKDENGNGCTAMLAAALTMAPRHSFWFTRGDKSDGPAKTPALSLVAHLGIPPLRLYSQSLNRKLIGLHSENRVRTTDHGEPMRLQGGTGFKLQTH